MRLDVLFRCLTSATGPAYGAVMLQVRVEGDPAEARAFFESLRQRGYEVQTGMVKNRGTFVHQYAVVRMPDYQPPAAPAAPPIRTTAVVSRPAIRGRRR